MAPSESLFSPEKPCKACADFKSWAKLSQSNVSTQKSNAETLHRNGNCPLDREQLGRSSWEFLHTLTAHYPDHPTEQRQQETKEFFRLFALLYPCHICAEDFQKQLERFPPKTDSQWELSQWLCRAHNRVNLKLGKELFDCSKVNERWRDGWKDGSCD